MWPKTWQGRHTTFVEYENGRIEMITDWTKLAQEIEVALLPKPLEKKIVRKTRRKTSGR